MTRIPPGFFCWRFVGNSFQDSVTDSSRDLFRDSIRDTFRYSVRDSTRDSIMDFSGDFFRDFSQDSLGFFHELYLRFHQEFVSGFFFLGFFQRYLLWIPLVVSPGIDSCFHSDNLYCSNLTSKHTCMQDKDKIFCYTSVSLAANFIYLFFNLSNDLGIIKHFSGQLFWSTEEFMERFIELYFWELFLIFFFQGFLHRILLGFH